MQSCDLYIVNQSFKIRFNKRFDKMIRKIYVSSFKNILLLNILFQLLLCKFPHNNA